MRFSPTGTILLAATLASGCATTETRSYRLDPAAPVLATWNGKPLTQVLDVWGAPTERENDGEGGTILVYREAVPITVSTSTGDGTKPPPPSPNAGDPSGSTKSERLTRVRARFWVDAQGTVYRYWFSNDVYEKGEGDLPAPKKPEPAQSDEGKR